MDIFAEIGMVFPVFGAGSEVATDDESCELVKTISVEPKKYEKLYLHFISKKKKVTH